MSTPEKLQQTNNYILSIDTADKDARVVLFEIESGYSDFIKIPDNQLLSSTLLSIVEELVRRNGVNKNELSGIVANSGPGSYTGLRIGLTTANFLSFVLNIPVYRAKNGQKIKLERMKRKHRLRFTNSVLPIYSSPPHITSPKPRRK